MTTMEQTLTVRVPFAVRRRGGRKLVLAPDGTMTDPGRPRIDNTMIKAIARAFRWRKLMETGVYGTVEEIAAAEKINASYVSRVLRLTLLAPEIVEAILAGRQPAEVTLAGLMGVLPVEWGEQGQGFPAILIKLHKPGQIKFGVRVRNTLVFLTDHRLRAGNASIGPLVR